MIDNNPALQGQFAAAQEQEQWNCQFYNTIETATQGLKDRREHWNKTMEEATGQEYQFPYTLAMNYPVMVYGPGPSEEGFDGKYAIMPLGDAINMEMPPIA